MEFDALLNKFLNVFLSHFNKFEEYNGKYCIIRSRDQGVMAGYVEGVFGRTVKLREARQLYSWSSNFVLVELASIGPRKDSEQRYSVPSSEPVLMLEACGVIPCSPEAEKKIKAIKAEEHKS